MCLTNRMESRSGDLRRSFRCSGAPSSHSSGNGHRIACDDLDTAKERTSSRPHLRCSGPVDFRDRNFGYIHAAACGAEQHFEFALVAVPPQIEAAHDSGGHRPVSREWVGHPYPCKPMQDRDDARSHQVPIPWCVTPFVALGVPRPDDEVGRPVEHRLGQNLKRIWVMLPSASMRTTQSMSRPAKSAIPIRSEAPLPRFTGDRITVHPCSRAT